MGPGTVLSQRHPGYANHAVAASRRTMTGPDHYRLADAEELHTDRVTLDDVLIGTTQVCATLAPAAATAMAS